MSRTNSQVVSLLAELRLTRASSVPLHEQVSEHLRAAIECGAISQGSILGNEIDLAAHAGLSRQTMRQALQTLVERGLVVRRKGLGTRVVQSGGRRAMGLSSLFDDLAMTAQQPGTRVLQFRTIFPDAELGARLRLDDPAEPVLQIIRLRLAGALPVAWMTNYLLAARFETLTPAELEECGLYEAIRRRGVKLHSATQTVGARIASSQEASQLIEVRGAALLTVRRTTYDDEGRVVELGDHLYAASRYSTEVTLLA